MTVVPYKDSDDNKKAQVANMFDNISPKYDLLNRVLSLGIDIYWRKQSLKFFKGHNPKLLLDIATGTADFAIEAQKTLKIEKVIGVDISEGMLSLGRVKLKEKHLTANIELLTGDSENLQFPDNTFDAITVAFGVRNFENLSKGLKEMHRVLKPGGAVVILEFSKPRAFPIKQIYWFYSNTILPLIGKLISKDASAYTYLPESVQAFPDGKTFTDILASCGFLNTQSKTLTFGIVSAYYGKK